jgi:hypothetical protein
LRPIIAHDAECTRGSVAALIYRNPREACLLAQYPGNERHAHEIGQA